MPHRVQDKNGCRPDANLIVSVIEYPKFFTPNNDGINDNWIIENMDNYPYCRVNIYNRWGQQIFQSIGYSEYQRWDGTRKGTPLPAGTYFYIVNSGSSIDNQTFKGSITLLR